jgi:hypothetical protein
LIFEYKQKKEIVKKKIGENKFFVIFFTNNMDTCLFLIGQYDRGSKTIYCDFFYKYNINIRIKYVFIVKEDTN